MDVRITSTGRTFYQVDPTLAAILLEMFPAAIEQCKRPTAQPVTFEPVFVANKNPYTGAPQIQLQIGQRNEFYAGEPGQAKSAFKTIGFECPDDVVHNYAELLRIAASYQSRKG
jgi:hypothetical protein